MCKIIKRTCIICIFVLIISLHIFVCVNHCILAVDQYKTAQLVKAIEDKDIEAARILLEKGVDPNKTNVSPRWFWVMIMLENNIDRPIRVAAETGNLEMVKLLVEYGATAEPIGKFKICPLEATLRYYHPNDSEIIDILLENGSSITETDGYGEEMVFIAAEMLPLSYGNFAAGYDEASARGITEIVCKLLGDRSVDITNERTGATLLMYGARSGNIYLVNYLISQGADVSIRNLFGRTALDYAKDRNRSEIIQILKEHGAT